MVLVVGKDLGTGREVGLPIESLRRHLAVLGSTGSGKTVLCKVVVEEAVRSGIPVIAVDPQGDIASLALREDAAKLAQAGTPAQVQQEFFDKARVAIFTPASSKGIPLCVNPLRYPSLDVPREEAVLAIDMTAASLAGILGYDLASPPGKAARACLFLTMEDALKRDAAPQDLAELARLIVDPPAQIAGDLTELITRKEAEELARKVKYLTVGASSLLFEMGVRLDLDTLLDDRDGKVPVNVIYLNSLTSDPDKQFFLTALLREVYLWMLKHPSNEVQLLVYVDEIAPYIPPYPRNPPPKEAYALLFKQARKYGVSLLATTQNVTDIDYKALGQVNTWCLGRLVMQQDVARVAKIVQSIDPSHAEQILGTLPSLAVSEFFLLSPDVRERIVRFKSRWLATQHRTLEESELSEVMMPSVRPFFERPAPPATPTAAPTGQVSPPAPAVAPSTTLQQAVAAALESLRAAVPAKVVAAKTNLPLEAIARELEALVKAGVCATGRAPGSKEDLYWLASDGFQPGLGLTREALEIPMRLAQVDAVRQASSLLEREFLSKAEEVAAAELDRLPIWKVTCQWTTKAMLLPAKEHLDDYYVSARSGSFMTIHGKEMRFEKLAREMAEKVQDLDDDERVAFEPRLPREVGTMPSIKVSLPQASEVLRKTFGVRPVEGRLALLPVWHLSVRQKDGSATRTVVMDAVTGRTLSGDF